MSLGSSTSAGDRVSPPSSPLQRAAWQLRAELPLGWGVEVVDLAQPGQVPRLALRVQLSSFALHGSHYCVSATDGACL